MYALSFNDVSLIFCRIKTQKCLRIFFCISTLTFLQTCTPGFPHRHQFYLHRCDFILPCYIWCSHKTLSNFWEKFGLLSTELLLDLENNFCVGLLEFPCTFSGPCFSPCMVSRTMFGFLLIYFNSIQYNWITFTKPITLLLWSILLLTSKEFMHR